VTVPASKTGGWRVKDVGVHRVTHSELREPMAKSKKRKTVLHFVPRTTKKHLPAAELTIPQVLAIMEAEDIPLTAVLVPDLQYDEDGYVVTLQWPVDREEE
jgi:hypothetical protein